MAVGPVGGAWLLAIAASASTDSDPDRNGSGGFHLTTLQVAGVAAIFAAITTVYAVRTYYARLSERESDQKSKNEYERAKAARAARAELEGYLSAIADTDAVLVRLQALRRDNKISPHRALRLHPEAFSGDERMAATHQRVLHRFVSVVESGRGHVLALNDLIPLAKAHRPDLFGPKLLDQLVAAELAIQKILGDKQILLEDVEALVAEMVTDAFSTREPRRETEEEPPD